MLGSLSEADDAVQEAWIRLSRSDAGAAPRARNGAVGFLATRDGERFSVGGFTIRGGRIAAMDILATRFAWPGSI